MTPSSSAAKADRNQERFYDALSDLFVGAAVEGQSGFINLMRIKSRYYTEGVFHRLQQDIAAALRSLGHDPNVRHSGSCPKSDSFRQELFDKLYDFFHRYFSPSGSIDDPERFVTCHSGSSACRLDTRSEPTIIPRGS